MERTDNKKMNTLRTNIAVAAITLLAAACSPSEPPPSPEQSAIEAVQQATAAYQRSAQLGFAWRPAKQSLAAAEAALASGDHAQALEAATLASKLADASIAQAQSEADAWQGRAPFNSKP